MATPSNDWFAQNAPKPPSGQTDWFAANAPSASATAAAPANLHAAILAKYNLPSDLDLTKPFPIGRGIDPFVFSRAYSEANPPEAPPTGFFSRAFHEAKSIVGGMFEPPPTAFGTLFNPIESARNVGELAKERGKEFQEHPAAATGATLTDIAAVAAPFALHAGAGALERNVLEPRRIKTGVSSLGKGLGIPTGEEAAGLAGRNAPDVINAARDLEIAKKDLASIERVSTVTQKGAIGTFARAQEVLNYNKDLWEQAHEAPIARNVNAPVNTQNLVAAGQRVLTQEAADASPTGQAQLRRTQKWLQDVISQPRSLGSADTLLREINADLDTPSAMKPYGPLGTRVQSAVADALRSEIENTLVSRGEVGVREANQRWGALNNIADRMIQSGISEFKTEAKAGVLPEWVNTYLFVHHGGTSGGFSIHPSALFTSKPSSQIASGLEKLGRTKLFPPPMPTPPITEFPAPTTAPEPLGPNPPGPPGHFARPNPPEGVSQVGGLPPVGFPEQPNLWAPPPRTAPAPQFQTPTRIATQAPPLEFHPISARGGEAGISPEAVSRPGLHYKITPSGATYLGKDVDAGTLRPNDAVVTRLPDGSWKVVNTGGLADSEVLARYKGVLDKLGGPVSSGVRPYGELGAEFRRLGMSNETVPPNKLKTLNTLIAGPRWKGLDIAERVQAIRNVLRGGAEEVTF